MRVDVLDFVGDGAGVALQQVGIGVRQRPPRDVDPQGLGGDGRHRLGSEVQGFEVERGVAVWFASQRVEARSQMAEVAERLDQGHARSHVVQLRAGHLGVHDQRSRWAMPLLFLDRGRRRRQ